MVESLTKTLRTGLPNSPLIPIPVVTACPLLPHSLSPKRLPLTNIYPTFYVNFGIICQAYAFPITVVHVYRTCSNWLQLVAARRRLRLECTRHEYLVPASMTGLFHVLFSAGRAILEFGAA